MTASNGSQGDVLDLLVVGGGPAGTAAGFRAKELGMRILVIDRDDVLTRIRDYAKSKAILPDFGGGDKMQFPDGGPLVKDLHFAAIDKSEMHAQWKALYSKHEVPSEVGVELVALESAADGGWAAKLWNARTKAEQQVRARHVALAIGGGMPRRLDIPGDVRCIATRLDDAAAFVGGSVCVIGGGTSAAEAVIAISRAKSKARDPSPVCWAYRGTTMPAVSRALADELFTAYTQGGNIRYLPGSEPVSIAERTGESVLSMEVDRKALADRPHEVLHLEFPSNKCIACIGQEIPERFLASLGVSSVTGGPQNRKGFVLSPLLETCRKNLFLIGDTLSPLYFETDNFQADPAEFREVKRRGNVKAALRDGVLIAEVVAQKLQGKTSIHVNVAAAQAPVRTPPLEAKAAPPADVPAPGVSGACLVSLLQGAVEAEEFAVKPGAVTSIGRRGCDVCFPNDTLLSDRHATIVSGPHGFMLRDVSGDGVFLRVTESRATEVPPGAIVSVGSQWLVFGPGNLSVTHHGPDGRERKRYPLHEGGALVIGRGADVPLDPSDDALSRRHMSIAVRNGVVSIRDLKSVNGTYLKVEKERRLEDGDEIRLGSQTLRFSLSRESRPNMTVQFDTAVQDRPPAPAAGRPGGAADTLAVVFQNIGKECPFAMGQSLCEAAEEHGVRIKAQCHEGRCGSDPIRIVSGAQHLNKLTDAESATLEELGLAPGEHRLACVTRPTGPVVVELLDPA